MRILVTVVVFVLLCLLKLGLQSLLLWIGARVRITRLRATYSRTGSMTSVKQDLPADESEESVYAFEFTETEDGEGPAPLPGSREAADIDLGDDNGSIIDMQVEVVRAISSPVPGRSSHRPSPIRSPVLFSSTLASSESDLHTPGQKWPQGLSSSDVDHTPESNANANDSSTISAGDHPAMPSSEPHSSALATAERRKVLRKAVSLSSLHDPRMLPTGPLRRTITNASSRLRAIGGRCERHGVEGCRSCRHRGGNPLSLSSIVLDVLSEREGHENSDNSAEDVYASALDLPSGGST